MRHSMAQSPNAQPLRRIAIVGGGTAGWMTAAFLSRFLDPARVHVTVVESEAIGTIGVGEATVPPLIAFLRLLGINEEELMVECHATYKLGIKFVHWHRRHAEVWHPFGPIGAPLVEGLPLFHHWLKNVREGRDRSSFSSYSLQALLADLDRAPRTLREPSLVTRHGAYAYHLDAREFAAYLARWAVRRGVEQRVDDVVNVSLDERGFIGGLQMARGGPIEADLYIDCTGFAGLLAEKTLGDPYIDWSPQLLCDRAVVLPLPFDRRLPPCTTATALSAGWAWRIPLSHRVGCGYVYSSRFTSDEDALAELARHVGRDPAAVEAEAQRIPMRVGRRTRFWSGNCVAVGLAAGFLEPLESTGLFLVQKGIELLLDHFPDRGFNTALAQRYNEALGAQFEQVRDFIALHYLLNGRDEPFWAENRSMDPPESLARTLALYDETALVEWDERTLFRDSSFYSIAAGFGRLPKAYHAMADQVDGERVWQAMVSIKAQNLTLSRSLPEHGVMIQALKLSAKPGGSGAP